MLKNLVLDCVSNSILNVFLPSFMLYMADFKCVWSGYRTWGNLLFRKLINCKYVTNKHNKKCFCCVD